MELMAPAGDIQSAYYALSHGADAVYLGLKEFSARKAARNLSFDQLRRICGFAHEQKKRVYVALNTVIRDDELPELLEVLDRLSLTSVDGLIVQDLGVAYLVRNHYPNLALHASTQLAVHSSEGVRFLASIGFSRVVLARELSFQEISRIRSDCPDVELKVFIHGALCYSHSGLCLASGLLFGASANRGECTQVCRTWSECVSEDGTELEGPDRFGFFFSMKDLAVKERLLDLAEIGIDAVKIEGRMKDPLYASSVSSYYRSILDGKIADDTMPRLAFSRVQTPGWAFSPARPTSSEETLICRDYPSHRGIGLGRIIEQRRQSLCIELSAPLAVRDGLLVLRPDTAHPGKSIPEAFSLKKLTDIHGRPITTAEAGMKVWIDTPGPFFSTYEIRKISSHDLNLPEKNPLSLSPDYSPIPCRVRLTDSQLTISCERKDLGFFTHFEFPVLPQRAQKESSFCDRLTSLLKNSNPEYLFSLELERFEELTSYGERWIFLPPRELKRIRNEIYDKLSSRLWAHLEHRRGTILISGLSDQSQHGLFDSRSSLLASQEFSLIAPEQIVFDPEVELKGVESGLQHTDRVPLVRIDSVDHILWYRRNRELSSHILGYCDTGIYCANRFASRLLFEQIPGCIGTCSWIEERTGERPESPRWSLPVILTDTIDDIPLFVSRSCFRHDSLQKSCASCGGRNHTYLLRQNERSFRVEVKDCRTRVYLAEGPKDP